MVTKIEKFKVFDRHHEKVEARHYSSGHIRYFVWQGERWWPLMKWMFERWRNNGVIVPD